MSRTQTSRETPKQHILPLPKHVVAQIRSAATITSLNGVVVELLKNSLDARATRIDATVDYARGSCIVEDNGLGIAPAEFSALGGLGKPYYTSKYYASEPLRGHNGNFLASLAAMSLLSIVSRHHEHRSLNSITFHHTGAVGRQTPIADHHHILAKHGTRVTVRNLFGNLPVRIKQRALASDDKLENGKQSAVLKRDIVALVLGGQGSMSLRVRDSLNRDIFNCGTNRWTTVPPEDNDKPQSSQLIFMLNILTQAKLIDIDDWPSWIPASASTSSVTIKGAISLNPAPSKQVQFITLGILPVSAEAGDNELYEEINRLFAMSSFGITEDDELKARKDVDRHPSFCLKISLNASGTSELSVGRFGYDEATLRSIVEVLRAMIMQWLSVHHFRPRQPRNKFSGPGSAVVTSGDSINTQKVADVVGQPSAPRRNLSNSSYKDLLRPFSAPLATRVHTPQPYTGSKQPSMRPGKRSFAQWSRIKSGRTDFFDTDSNISNAKSAPDSADLPSLEIQQAFQKPAVFDIDRFAEATFQKVDKESKALDEFGECTAPEMAQEDAILWTDPSSKKVYLLNARTGCIMSDVPNSELSTRRSVITQKDLVKPVRLAQRSKASDMNDTPFLKMVLQSWNNPVFATSETRIQQVSVNPDVSSERHNSANIYCAHPPIDQYSHTNSAPISGRLSKASLSEARVLAQVDKKFILVAMVESSSTTLGSPADLLVLIDQHAADERIQVERLFSDLCTSIAQDMRSYQSSLGHRASVTSILLEKSLHFSVSAIEHEHFVTHARRFAEWGILYDAPPDRLSVTCLPPTIAQRCQIDPPVLISCLRSTVWEYVEGKRSPNNTTERAGWTRRVADCPQGIVDMINSRACRSAIMFNDLLSLEDCKALVQKLAGCTFPFMCAHGRPSMVPVIGLGDSGFYAEGKEERKTFVGRYKTWRKAHTLSS